MEDDPNILTQFKSPGFILEKDIEPRVNGFTILCAVEKVIGEDQLESLQNVRGVWRLYPMDSAQKVELCRQGIEINGKKVKIHSQNPFYTNTNTGSSSTYNPRGFVKQTRPDTTRLLIKDVYRSVSNTQIKSMLENKYKVRVHSNIMYSYVRNDDNELTNCKNCDRFCYVYSEDLKVPLPRVAKCGKWECRLFHANQTGQTKRECNNCYETDHFGKNCPNEKRCRICRKPGHDTGSSECEFFEKQENLIAFGGGDDEDIFSNHFECSFEYKHVDFNGSEICWFYHKAMICLQPDLAREIYNAKDAKHAKRLSKRIRCAPDWDTSAVAINLMKDILTCKFTQVEKCHNGLKKAFWENQALVEAVPTWDTWWGSSMTPEETLNIRRDKWPGKNKLGLLLEEVAIEMCSENPWPKTVVGLDSMDTGDEGLYIIIRNWKKDN